MENDLTKSFQTHKFIVIFIFVLLVAISGCTSFGKREVLEPRNKTENKPSDPPAPVVVDGVRTSYADLVEKTTPAVVQITASIKKDALTQTDSPFDEFFPRRMPKSPPRQGFGSGVLVSEDGIILTNHHVIKNANKIRVEMKDRKTFDAKIVGSDPPSDLAVLKIKGKEFPFLKLGNSEKVRIGDIVLAIGNPLGIGQSVTSGIISAKGRQTNLGDGSFQDFLQTDAPINRGNSGGALVNVNGELIGINSQILSRTGGNIGIGFSIPSNMARSVMEQLIETGKVRRGMLGIKIRGLDKDDVESLNLKDTNGLLVNKVDKGSAAEKAGVKQYDVIVAINGEKIENSNALRNKVAGTKPGTEVILKIIRNGKENKIKVVLGEFALDGVSPKSGRNNGGKEQKFEKNGKLGLNLQPLPPELAAKSKLPSGASGVVINGIEPNSPASEKGLRSGDIILEINRKKIKSLSDVRSVLSKSGRKAVLLLVARGERTFTVSIKPQKQIPK